MCSSLSKWKLKKSLLHNSAAMLNCTCTSIYGDVQMCSSYHIWSQDWYWIYGKTPKFTLKAENEFKFGHLVSVVCVWCPLDFLQCVSVHGFCV